MDKCFVIQPFDNDNANEQGYKREAIIYVCLAILFQPLIKIALGRVV